MIAIIDNYDSLVFNIARYLRELGETTEVIRNDAISVSELYQLKPRHQPGRRDSIELRHRLKADGHSVPVIYMTGNEPPCRHAAALQSGCLAYLTKPISAKSLIEPLERASAS